MDEQTHLVRKIFKDSPYQVQLKISEGSYGEVYRVTHKINQQQFALKVIDMERVSKLNKTHQVVIEIKTLKGLQHPGVIKYIETLSINNYMGVVTELAPYGDLFSFIATVHAHPQLSERKYKIATFYVAQALEILDYLHEQGIQHRDIKPENFVMGADLRLRIIDFATSRIEKGSNLISQEELDSLKSTSENEGLVGSANYLSPEALKLQYSTKSDVWSFGVLAYKFFLNKLPFEGSNQEEIFSKIVSQEIDLLKTDPKVEELLVMCLKKDPHERATAKMLKICSLFNTINFKQIFTVAPPISKSDLSRGKSSEMSQFIFEQVVQKKMFFGNFKPRLLTISHSSSGLKMAYRYIETRKIKNQFELTVNDYASLLENREFQVRTKGNSYVFRVKKEDRADKIVNQINFLIRQAYQLE